MRNQGYRVDPRLDLGCAILIWIYMILIVHATIVRRRRKPGCWRRPQLESLRWILFCFLLNCPHSGFRRIFGYAEIRRCKCRRLVPDLPGLLQRRWSPIGDEPPNAPPLPLGKHNSPTWSQFSGFIGSLVEMFLQLSLGTSKTKHSVL